MRRVFLRCVAMVGVLTCLPILSQRAAGQALREPTIDERYRDAGAKTVEGELPTLTPPTPTQAKPVHEYQQPASNTGPAYLGVTFNSDDVDAVVRSVTPGSPAAQAGLQPTDVVESIQGRRVRSYQDVLDTLARMRPGDTLDIEFSRRMSVRTKAALTGLPPAVQHTAGYPPEATHELLPVPTTARNKMPAASNQPSRNDTPQNRNGYSSDQRRYNNQNNGRSDDNRRLLGRGLRGR